MTKVAVFISGGGSNLQSLIDASADGRLEAQISWVVSSKLKAFGLKRAEEAGIETFVYKQKNYNSPTEAADDLFAKLTERGIDYIATAGYLSLLPENVVKNYKNKIINIHPALLPKYGGKGMYGQNVHKAVIANGDSQSGPTVHLVDEIYDNGQILEQIKIDIHSEDTPETLASRVLVEEHKLFPEVLDNLIKGKYELNNG